MKKAKKVLCAVFLLSLSIKAENIAGRTRNPNILRLNKHMYIQFSGEENSQNIFRDLACHCDDSSDNPAFKMRIVTELEPYAPIAEIEKVLEDPLINPLFLNACKILAPGQDIKNIKQLLVRNPKIRAIAMQLYVDHSFKQMDKNTEKFVNNNLKELLLSKGSDGKSALDIAREKPEDELGCVLLREVFESIAERIGVQEDEKQQRLQEEINKNQR